MRMIFSPKDEGEAAFLISLLEAEGIPAQIWNVRGEGGQTPPQIWLLNDADSYRAGKVIQNYMKNMENPGPKGDSWKCDGCGEKHEAAFSDCWKCGRSRKG